MEFLIGILGAIVAMVIFFVGMIMGWAIYDRERLKEKGAEYHDDKTLDKVRAALMKRDEGVFTASYEGAQDLIRKMQNAGILFRERR